jgi:rSAM/selenodomain-associated transferase 1
METSVPRPEQLRIAVFAKAPVAGAVKTRLAPLLGAEGAARLHRALVRRALGTALRAGVAVELWCTPDAGDPFFTGCAREFGVRLRVQEGATLGDRMGHAIAAGPPGVATLLIGSDCPALDAEDLLRAAGALATHDAVFIPAEDGGYVLVGLARPASAPF